MGKTLVVGVGSSLMGDDGLGVHALQALRARGVPAGVDTVEAASAVLDALPDLRPYEKVILLDAVAADSEGVQVIRGLSGLGLARGALSAHQLGIEEALQARLLLEGSLPEIVIMGLRPRRIQFSTELSEEVATGIGGLVEAVLAEVGQADDMVGVADAAEG